MYRDGGVGYFSADEVEVETGETFEQASDDLLGDDISTAYISRDERDEDVGNAEEDKGGEGEGDGLVLIESLVRRVALTLDMMISKRSQIQDDFQ